MPVRQFGYVGIKMGVLINREQFQMIVSGDETCLVLNSRQSKRPCRADKWVTATEQAIRHYCSRNCLFLTSIGMNSWELAVHLVNIYGGRQIVVIPSDLTEYGYDTTDDVLRKFRLDDRRTRLTALHESESSDQESWPQRRDEFLIANAQILVPVAVRPSGRLQSLLDQSNAMFDDSFRIPYHRSVDRVRYDWNRVKLNLPVSYGWNGLTHWTRSAFGPFDSEDHCDYYSAILKSNSYPYSAIHILEQIMRDRRIRASGRFIRGGYRVVSLTALKPTEAIELMRWRKRYAYYSFEPYGIALDAAFASHLGCRPVQYGTPSEFNSLGELDRPFFQNAGSEVAEWRPEAEWRHIGDLNLQDVPAEMMRIYTYRESEMEKLQRMAPCQVITLTVGD